MKTFKANLKFNLLYSLVVLLLAAFAIQGCESIEDDEYDDEPVRTRYEEPPVVVTTPPPSMTNERGDVLFFPVTVQIGAFKNRHLAENFMNKAMSTHGTNFRLFQSPSGLFKIQFGTYSDLHSAMSALSTVRNSGYYDAFVTEYR